jgi:LmbE family N-acetylglucosaminyl deacetylase
MSNPRSLLGLLGSRRRVFGFAGVGLLAIMALTGARTWLANSRAWKRDLAASGFVDEMATPGRGERILVVAPHPDDETLGCGGLMQEAAARGAAVQIALVTNGDASELSVVFGERELPWSPQAFINLGQRRQHETLRAVASLGIPPDHVHFLGYPNNGLVALWRPEHWPYSRLYRSPRTAVSLSPYVRSLTRDAPYCGQQVLSDLITLLREVQPTAIFVTHPQDVHPDHWATCAFVQYALATIAARGAQWARNTRVYGYLVHWPRYPLPRRFSPRLPLLPPSELASDHRQWLRLPLSPQVAQTKLRAIRDYHSQEPVFARLLLDFARANETFELLSPASMPIGGAHEWRLPAVKRRALNGVQLARLRLALGRLPGGLGPTLSAQLDKSPLPVRNDAYVALDVRVWDEYGAPVIATVYAGAGLKLRAARLGGAGGSRQGRGAEPKVPVPVSPRAGRRPNQGEVVINPFPLPADNLVGREFFVTCWGSVLDRVIDPGVMALVRLHPPGDYGTDP